VTAGATATTVDNDSIQLLATNLMIRIRRHLRKLLKSVTTYLLTYFTVVHHAANICPTHKHLLTYLLNYLVTSHTVTITYQHSDGQFVVRQAFAAVLVKNSKEFGRSVLAFLHKLHQFLDWRHLLLCTRHIGRHTVIVG